MTRGRAASARPFFVFTLVPMTLETLSLPAPAQIEVLRKRLAERRGDEALAGAEAELVAFPDDRDLLLIKAQALRAWPMWA